MHFHIPEKMGTGLTLSRLGFKAMVTCFLLTAISFISQAQNKGLARPQDPAELPKSRASVSWPVALPGIASVSRLDKVSINEWIISGGWELAAAKQINSDGARISTAGFPGEGWINATVPGTILKTLVDRGYYPDPLYGLNNLVIPDTLCRTDWWYRTLLPVPEGSSGRRIELLFNGINYRADVWVNGSKAGSITGAFIRGRFDITGLLRTDGKNVLAVHIFPPPHPGIPHEQNAKDSGPNGGLLCYDGPTFVCTEGWDWVPGIRDRNMGLWQDVRLRVTSGASIVDPQVICDLPLPDTSSAKLTIKALVRNNALTPGKYILKGEIGDVLFEKEVSLKAGEERLVDFRPDEFPLLNFRNPRLWWPNGYGRQELYTLKLTMSGSGGNISDTRETRFGIREMSYDFTVDYQRERQNVRINLNPLKVWARTEKIINYRMHGFECRRLPNGVFIGFVQNLQDTVLFDRGTTTGAAPYLVIKVNGQPVYCRGGNWGLDDAIKRVSRDRMEPYFRLHRDAGFTMIRNWVGQSTGEVFYELADEYGILIWNDFWMSTENYNLDPWDNQLFLDNARDAVRRFRNHPSIALWCGRNEGNPPMALDDSLHIIQAREDGTRIFHSSSIKNNLANSGPWFYGDFARKEIHGKEGFNTETGAPAIPVAETMKAMMAPEDLWPIGDAWYYHDLHRGQKDYIRAIEEQYGEYSSLEEFCRKAQMLNYEIYREIFEVWNYRLWNSCSGLLLWMSHPAWPSTVWQTYSYDYETNGVFYGSRKACEPLHVQFQPGKNDVYFINNTLKSYKGLRTEIRLYSISGKEIFEASSINDSEANCRVMCFLPQLPLQLPVVYIARLKTFNSEGVLLAENTYLRSTGDKKDFTPLNNLPEVKIGAKITAEATVNNLKKYTLTVFNNTRVPAISVKLNLRSVGTGKRILPSYISDGYFTLLPGESRTLAAECPVDMVASGVAVTAEGYNVPFANLVSVIRLK